jgi:hypothetical protein
MMMGNDDGVMERISLFSVGGWWEGRMTWDADVDVDVGKQ